MCGIVAYVGKNNASSFLLRALEKLEYRGYDSAGIAVCKENKLNLIKKKGRINVLREALQGLSGFEGFTGIGHTRWATHGEPSDVNSHPHTGNSGKIAIVHNGIIENYMVLKNNLIKKGVNFSSETDSEVVAALIDSSYEGDIFEAVRRAIPSFEGSFALGILCSDFPDQIIAVKKESPLVLGFGDGENYIASDISAFVEDTRNICRLNENEMALIKADSVSFYNFKGEKINKNITKIDWNVGSSDKGGFEHFMMKEIMEQPSAIRETISPRISNGEIVLKSLKNFNEEYLKNVKKIFVIACGSSYHVGLASRFALEKLTKLPVEVELASEFRYRSPIVDETTLLIVISQSGETADSLAALREGKRRGAKVMAIVNVVGSSIASEADFVFYTWAGIEVAVATTKAYSSQLASTYLVALYVSKILKTVSESTFKNYLNYIELLPELVEKILLGKEKIYEIAKKYYQCDNVFFIGRGVDYAVCMEGSLKFKEISYIHSEAYAAGELKHGTISLIESGTLVIAVATDKRLFEKISSNIREVKARGAVCMAITIEPKKEEISYVANDVFFVSEIPEIFLPSLAVIPLQLFSYYSALLRGRDIDKPRNLAKSVTVE
ncbi:MAG: glutamine--fructose-6-phosphate transaminase (isomerizing) [Oscillospiraceae bacterium]|jgi:glucosamine--fructose-6-phosphate aminotransferase (isomerizing)|nr:glutamine--fructose-6-phosphate transaminase (isomerizing) [Oscillospiraceae bacterium]